IRDVFEVPAEMFACDPHPGVLSVECVEGFEMRENDSTHFGAREHAFRLLCGHSGFQKRIDSAKNPRRAVRRAAEHYSVRSSEIKYVARLLRRVDISVGEHWNFDQRFYF